MKGNIISENGVRGIGIQSFAGSITGNNIIENGLYAIENESTYDVSAEANWWGKGDIERKIYDKSDDQARGAVVTLNAMEEPIRFLWPVKNIRSDITWRNTVIVKDHVETYSGATLKILPGTNVMFSEGAGMRITESKILAIGKKDKRILFTSSEEGGNKWDEILLEHADGSIFSYCDFEYANWALHSHFTNLRIDNSIFRKNNGGMRFRSGPINIAGSLFTQNRIGVRAFRANAMITENTFKNNQIGVFIREKGGGLTLRNNNIYSNKDYNIRVGDFDKEDVDARENWWGTLNPAETLFDGRIEPGVGKVIFEPFYKEMLIIER